MAPDATLEGGKLTKLHFKMDKTVLYFLIRESSKKAMTFPSMSLGVGRGNQGDMAQRNDWGKQGLLEYAFQH